MYCSPKCSYNGGARRTRPNSTETERLHGTCRLTKTAELYAYTMTSENVASISTKKMSSDFLQLFREPGWRGLLMKGDASICLRAFLTNPHRSSDIGHEAARDDDQIFQCKLCDEDGKECGKIVHRRQALQMHQKMQQGGVHGKFSKAARATVGNVRTFCASTRSNIEACNKHVRKSHRRSCCVVDTKTHDYGPIVRKWFHEDFLHPIEPRYP